MKLFHRKDVPPPEIVAALPKGERVVSWADTAAGEVVLATPAGLWWPEAEGPRLIGWQHIDKATWRERVLVVIEAAVEDDLLLVDRPPVAVELAVPRDLPPVIRKRIEANVVRSEVTPVPGGSARFVARRVPGADGLAWWARLEPGTRDTAETRAVVAARIERLKADWQAERALL